MATSEPLKIRLGSSKKDQPVAEQPPAEADEKLEDAPLLEEWDGGKAKRTLSFYHAEGAPYLDDDGNLHPEPPAEELAAMEQQGLAVPPTILEAIVAEVVPIRHENVIDEIYHAKAPKGAEVRVEAKVHERHAGAAEHVRVKIEQGLAPLERSGFIKEPFPEAAERARTLNENRRVAAEDAKVVAAGGVVTQEGGDPSAPRKTPSNRVKRPFDITGIEQLAFLALNGIFPDGIRIPIRKEGMMDFDVVIKGKEIMIDVKGPLADVPSLAVWRLTFAFEGEPLAMYGRGVKGDVKVYKLRVLKFIIRASLAKRKRKRLARLKARDDWGAFSRRKAPGGGAP